MREVEGVVFESCPHIEATFGRARAAIVAAKVEADLRVVVVGSDDEALRLRFLGSPTVRVNGVGVEPSSRAREDFGLQCRLYLVEGRLGCGPPPVDWIASMLRAVPGGSGTR